MTAYFDRPSPIHALDPRVKIAWSVVVSLSGSDPRPSAFVGSAVCTYYPALVSRAPTAGPSARAVRVGGDYRSRHDDLARILLRT